MGNIKTGKVSSDWCGGDCRYDSSVTEITATFERLGVEKDGGKWESDESEWDGKRGRGRFGVIVVCHQHRECRHIGTRQRSDVRSGIRGVAQCFSTRNDQSS